jgi:hypothetical protein
MIIVGFVHCIHVINMKNKLEMYSPTVFMSLGKKILEITERPSRMNELDSLHSRGSRD